MTKQIGKPVYKLMGGGRRAHLTPYATIFPGMPQGRTLKSLLDETFRQFEKAKEIGFRAMKMEVLYYDLVTDLEPIAPGLSEQTGADAPEGRRYRLFEAVAGLLDELSAEVPVLLLLDDLHWSDQGTAAILRYALDARPEMRVLVLATVRTAEMPATGPKAEALQRLSHGPYVERNRILCDKLLAGRYDEAQESLWTYLDDAMTEVVAAVDG